MCFEVILPFLRPIEHLILDAQVTEIMVNGAGPIFIERDGRLEPVVGVRLREQSLQVAIRNMARALGDDISAEKPLLDSRLPDGSRVAAVLPPCSLGGTTLTIRKFQSRLFTVEELVRIGTLTAGMVACVHHAMDRRENILISGGTGTGKAMSRTTPCPHGDRAIVDTAKTCCFCGRSLDVGRLTAVAVCTSVSDGGVPRARAGSDVDGRAPVVVHAFPVASGSGAPGGQTVTVDTPPPASASGPSGSDGEPPEHRGLFFRTPPSFGVVTSLTIAALLLTLLARLLPDAAAYLELLRGFVTLGTLYWLLLSPFTSRTREGGPLA